MADGIENLHLDDQDGYWFDKTDKSK